MLQFCQKFNNLIPMADIDDRKAAIKEISGRFPQLKKGPTPEMNDAQISKIYLTAYLALFFMVQTVLVWLGTELDSPRGIINTVLTYLAFVPAAAYVYDRLLPFSVLWRLFAGLFFAWQILGFFYLYDHPLRIRLIQVLMTGPLYWSVGGYALITACDKPDRKSALVKKRDELKEKPKGLMIIASALAMLLLMICLFVMIQNYWHSHQTI